MDRGAWQATVHGVAKSLTQPKWLSTQHAHALFQYSLVISSRLEHGNYFLNWPAKLENKIRIKNKYQFSSVTQSCPTLCDPMDCSTPGLFVHHRLPELTQTHVRWVGDGIPPSHPLSSPYPPAFNRSLYQGLFQWVSSLHQVAKVLELQHQYQSFQWIFMVNFL